MGTAGSSRGSGSATPLVPSWLDEPAEGPLPGSGETEPGEEEGNGAEGEPQSEPEVRPEPPIRPPPVRARFRSGRQNFSSFAGSGGRDRAALRRAARDYVRSGTGGSGNAVRRMGVARNAAGGALGVFRGFQRDGVAATLNRLNLQGLVGRPAGDVFLGLTDTLCPDGGSIDEGIVRDAWCETVAELEGLGIADLDAMTAEQMREFFLAFVAHSIENRLYQEIGVNGFRNAPDLAAIDSIEAQLHSYIRRALRDCFEADLTQLAELTDDQVRSLVDQTYREAWELLQHWGDSEE